MVKSGNKARRLLLLAAQKQTEGAGKWKTKRIPEGKEEEVEEADKSEGIKDEKAKEDMRRRYSINKDVLMRIKNTDSPRLKRKSVRTFCVKKVKPKVKGKKTIVVHVMKPADPDSPLKPQENVINYAGPRFTKDGRFIEHSILGSMEEFKTEARRNRQYSHLYQPTMTTPEYKKIKDCPVKESNYLVKWKTTIKDWNKTQTYLSGKLHRPVDDLLMRTTDIYPAWVKERQRVADTLEAALSGSGEGRGFWKQYVKLGHDDGIPLFTTLKDSDRGDTKHKEIIEIPNLIKSEKGQGKITLDKAYKPYYTNYLQEQRENLRDVIHISSHHLDLADLVVQGQIPRKAVVPPSERVTYQGHITVHKPIPIIEELEPELEISGTKRYGFQGPALGIGEQILTWINTTAENPLRPVTLFFNTKPGQKQIEKISLMNYGSTAIRYDWEKIPKKNAFGLVKPRVEQFYFLSDYGALPPGGEVELPVLFKSDFPGMFKQTWKLKTGPVLCGGKDILISFVGRTLPDVIFQDELDELEERLSCISKVAVVNYALKETFVRVMTPTRPRSPVSTYQTPEMIFNQSHPGFVYHSSTLNLMEKLYYDVCKSGLILPEPKEPKEPFTIENLRKVIIMLDSLELPPTDSENYRQVLNDRIDKQEEFTEDYFTLISDLSFTHPQISCDLHLRRLHICRQIFHLMVEDFSSVAYNMAYRVKIPIKSLIEETQKDKKKRKPTPVNTKQKKGGKDNGQKGPAASKGRLSKTPTPKKAESPPAPTPSPQPPKIESFSPVIKEKATEEQLEAYREKLYIQVYSLLQSAIDRMDYIFNSFDNGQQSYPR